MACAVWTGRRMYESKERGEKMSQQILVELEMPADLDRFRLPKGVNRRLQDLLDRQDRSETLTSDERLEAEGLVNLSELLSLLRLRAQKISQDRSSQQ